MALSLRRLRYTLRYAAGILRLSLPLRYIYTLAAAIVSHCCLPGVAAAISHLLLRYGHYFFAAAADIFAATLRSMPLHELLPYTTGYCRRCYATYCLPLRHYAIPY